MLILLGLFLLAVCDSPGPGLFVIAIGILALPERKRA